MNATDITVAFSRNGSGDMRMLTPGLGTGILDVLRVDVWSRTPAYDRFLLVWRGLAHHLGYLKQMQGPAMLTKTERRALAKVGS